MVAPGNTGALFNFQLSKTSESRTTTSNCLSQNGHNIDHSYCQEKQITAWQERQNDLLFLSIYSYSVQNTNTILKNTKTPFCLVWQRPGRFIWTFLLQVDMQPFHLGFCFRGVLPNIWFICVIVAHLCLAMGGGAFEKQQKCGTVHAPGWVPARPGPYHTHGGA